MALYWDLKKQKHQLATDYRRNREQYLTASLSLIFIVLILTYFGPFEDLRRFGALTFKRMFSSAAGPVQLVEAESATFSGPMTVVSDSSASGGSYILSTVSNLNDPTAPPPAVGSPTPTPLAVPNTIEQTTTSEATPESVPVASPSPQSSTSSANLLSSSHLSYEAVLQATSVDSGSATFTVNLANAGTYTIWTRMWGNDSGSDSFWLSVDGQPAHNVGDGGFPFGSWQWVNWEDGSPTSKISLNLTAGVHTLTVYGREAGTRIDRILLTADLVLVPTGFGELPSPTPIPVSATSSPSSFLETFDGAPSAPERFLPSSKWAVTVHQRDTRYADFYGMSATDAHHDATCSPPNLTHPVGDVEDSVFKCRNHVMTAINGIGYTLVYLMPNHMVDFSQGEAVISWDMSTEQSSFDRDWVDLWITPWDDQMRLPHDGRGADLQGGPKNAVHFVSGRFKFDTRIIRNYVLDKDLGGGVGWDTFLVPDRARRDKFELRISRTHLKFCMPAYNKCWVDDNIADLGWSKGVVQLGHHSYNPEKNGELPGTWHWDNVSISPSVPFTMIQANRRYVDKNAPEALGFSAPAPANAYLNFGALGIIDASFDGGNSWQRATRQLGQDQAAGNHKANIFSSYWMPIPQGTSSVLFRQGEWCDGPFCGVWHVRDISIFSQTTAAGGPVPTVASPTPSPVVVSTPTPIPTPTPTPIPTPTPTPIPTSTTSNASKINWLGQNWNVTGANIPWFSWGCDFGCGQNGGVVGNQSTISNGLATLKNAGAHTARWWVFPGNPWQITRDSSGAPSGINPAVYADIDAALNLANTHDLYYNFVLFSQPTAIPNGWITDPTQRAKLASVLGELFARYRNNPRILSWEPFNEPEWDIWNNKIDEASTVATGKAIVDSIHANSSALATIGHAMLDGIKMWTGAGLDYYSPHWYDYMSSGGWCAICTDAATVRSRFGINKPIVLGEFFLGTSLDGVTRLNDFYNKGYAGVWAWSLFPDRTNDKLQIDLNAMKTFTSFKIDIGPRGLPAGGPIPTSTPVAIPSPTPTTVATPVPTPVATPSPTPIPTPLLTPTPVVIVPTPTPISSPAPVACAITQASWGTNNASAGLQVTLNATGTTGCADQQVSFVVAENDSILEGLGDDQVTTNPVSVNFNGTTATGSWTAQYQEDGLLGVFDPPEYYFKVTLVSNPSQTLRSADPLLTVPKPTAPPSASTGGFLETFTGLPTAPQPFFQTPASARFDVTLHDRNPDRWYQLKDMTKMHGPDCAGPPAVHPSDRLYETAVFQCRNHMMTAINVGDYGVLYLTPNHMVDFSQGEAVVSFDMSTFKTSTRDWVDLWITPYDQNLALPLDSGLPDLSGEPRNTVNLRMESGGGGTRFEFNLVRNFVLQKIEQVTKGYEQVLTPDRARRDKFELRISRTHVKFGMPAYNLWWIDMNIADLGWDKATVQLGHHSYTPEKSQDCTQAQLDTATCGPNTWHWDNVSINPSIPFSIIKATRRYADKTNLTTPVTFTSAAPANSNLRFSAVGKIEVSFNGGATWQAARRQPSIESQDGGTPAHPEHFSSYWMPIASGVSSVMFRGGSDGGYTGRWFVRDMSIFSQTATGGPISSPIPTVASPTPVATPTPTPTPTPRPTPTPTPVPSPFPANFSLLTPANNATNVSGNPTFDWSDSTGATNYWVYVASSSASSWSWVKNVTTSNASWNNGSGWVQVTATSPAIPTTLSNGSYKWWVVARNASGDTWASPNAFTFTVGSITATPTPSSTPVATSPTPSPAPTGSVIKIYAAGQAARGKNPTMKLRIAGVNVATYNVGGNALTGQFQVFTYTSKTKVTPDKVRVRFTNDYYSKSTGLDRNLRVDRIEIDGVTYQTEAATVESRGSWNQQTGCSKGFKLSEWLHCNGYFQYR